MAKDKVRSDDPFNEENEVQSNWVKFNVPLEDKIFGTLIARRKMKSTMAGKEGTMVMVYDIKGDLGSYHRLDELKKLIEEPVIVEPNSFHSVGGTAVIDRQMQNIKVGQKVGFKYIEEKPSKQKGFAPAKIVKVYAPKNEDGTPKMDEEFLRQQAVENFDAEAAAQQQA